MFEKHIHLHNSESAQNRNTEKFLHYATVIDINDPIDAKRVKVRIKGVDDKLLDDVLPWASSFLPLNFATNPKVGEMVKIIIPSKNDIFNKREWIGPVFSSYENLEYQSANTALATQEVSGIQAKRRLDSVPEVKDAYIKQGEVGFQGRDNTDIVFKDKEVLIRAGKFVFNDNTKANLVNPSYLQVKLDEKGETSYANLVGNKICLISHEGKFAFNRILDEAELLKIVEDALSATYAEPLIEFLKLIQDFVANHIHASNLPANKGIGSVPQIAKFDLDSIIAKNIKIN